jgi:hypothetical protein
MEQISSLRGAGSDRGGILSAIAGLDGHSLARPKTAKSCLLHWVLGSNNLPALSGTRRPPPFPLLEFVYLVSARGPTSLVGAARESNPIFSGEVYAHDSHACVRPRSQWDFNVGPRTVFCKLVSGSRKIAISFVDLGPSRPIDECYCLITAIRP